MAGKKADAFQLRAVLRILSAPIVQHRMILMYKSRWIHIAPLALGKGKIFPKRTGDPMPLFRIGKRQLVVRDTLPQSLEQIAGRFLFHSRHSNYAFFHNLAIRLNLPSQGFPISLFGFKVDINPFPDRKGFPFKKLFFQQFFLITW